VAISRFHFHRVFKQITGATPRDYARTHRLGRFADKLDSGQPVAEAIYASGFGSSSRAYEAAPSGLGMTPGARRHGGIGQTIRFVTVETPIGWALSRRPSGHLHDGARRRSREPRRRAAATVPCG
jgi:AraC family transcriptional regulator of adaptative response/methylated-DNA-[protein]-cysteine methyltransferase